MTRIADDPARLRLTTYLRRFRRRLLGLVLAERLLLLGCGGLVNLALALLAGERGFLQDAALSAVRVVMLVYWVGALVCLVGVWLGVRRLDLMEMARRIERRRPALQGRLTAAAWLLDAPASGAPDYMARRCLEDAAHAVGAVSPPSQPAAGDLRRRAVLAAVTLTGLVAAHLLAPQRLDAAWAALGGRSQSGAFVRSAGEEPPRLAGAEIDYVFPEYTGLQPRRSHGPGDLAALAGSVAQVRFRLIGHAHEVQAFTQDGDPLPASVSADGRRAQVEVALQRDGGYRVSLLSSDGEEWSRHLFRIRALPDAPPVVRITQPARDLEMIRPGGVLEVAGIASDEFSVAQVALRFLVTAGSGETYRFEEGVLPLALHQEAGQVHVRAELDIGALLGAEDDHGGVVSYHLEATDANRRSGPGVGLSETFLVRVAGDESVPLEMGGAMLPLENQRVSQRQILEETRRLHVRREQMDLKGFQSEARVLAEKESELRASFAGLSEQGGEWAHEEEEGGEGVLEIPGIDVHLHGSVALPYSPAVLEALNQAIGAMFQAELFLHLAETDKAMPYMLDVIRFLQEARKHDRLLFRALPVAVSLDPAARGAGELDDVENPPPAAQPEVVKDDRATLLQEVRHGVQSQQPVIPEQLQEWSHRAFALPDGMEAATALARAASNSATRGDDLRRAAGLLALLLQSPENSPAPTERASAPLADHYFASLAGGPPR